MATVDPTRSLEDLEGHHWGEAPDGATRLVATAHELRRKPIGELTVEDLRLLISQRVGLSHLVPIALDLLQNDPMAEGDMYEGDLLRAVLRIGPDFWAAHTDLLQRLHAVIDAIADPPKWLTTDLLPALESP
nr:contact-dependent growth inhibition system immunity protein [Polymorphospora rubra]